MLAAQETTGEETEEPAEVTKLRESFVNKLEPLIVPMKQKLEARLKALETSFGRDGKFDEGLTVKRYREEVIGRPIEEAGSVDLPNEPEKLREELVVYSRQVSRSAAPWRRIFLREIEKLQSGFVEDSRLADARYAKLERERLERLWNPESSSIERRNVASAKEGAEAFADKNPKALNDGNSTKFDEEKGWAAAKVPGDLRVELAEVFTLTKIRFRLWDEESKRKYKYRLHVSAGDNKWELLADMSDEFQRSWQTFEFSAQPVKSIRIEAVASSAPWPWLHVVELEAY